MFKADILGVPLVFETERSLFSPNGPDAGTLAMITRISLSPHDKLLDLGCGYGLVGCWAAARIGADRVLLADNDPVAVDLATRNLARNGFGGAAVVLSDGLGSVTETGFTRIVSHPPYHADFKVPKAFIEKGFNRLAIGGELWMVTRREPWYRNKLSAIFGGVQVFHEGGYAIFKAEKRGPTYANARR